MKGYTVESGYMGYIDGAYMLFADERDYEEAFLEEEMQKNEKQFLGKVTCFLRNFKRVYGILLLCVVF